jgi:hypothetical protein
METPIMSTPRRVQQIQGEEPLTWGLRVTFDNGEDNNNIEWWFPTEEALYTAFEMWEDIIHNASEYNYTLEDE